MLYPTSISPAAIAANTIDYAPPSFAGTYWLRLDETAEWTISGIAGGTDGRTIAIQNIGAFNLIFLDQDATSVAVNRFDIGPDYVLAPDATIILVYALTRWTIPAAERDIQMTVLQPNGSRIVPSNRVTVSYGWFKLASLFTLTIEGNSKYVIL
jgi:hypothetical protein